jgi:hypothetical protein
VGTLYLMYLCLSVGTSKLISMSPSKRMPNLGYGKSCLSVSLWVHQSIFMSVGTSKHIYVCGYIKAYLYVCGYIKAYLYVCGNSIHYYLSVCGNVKSNFSISVVKPKLFNMPVLREHQTSFICLSVGTTKAYLSPNENVTPYLSVGTGEGVVIRIYILSFSMGLSM